MFKTIQIEEKTHNILSNLKVNNDTFDDVILRLVNFYNDGKEEFSDEKAQYYNDVISKIENGNYEDFTDLPYNQIKNNIKTLESELNE